MNDLEIIQPLRSSVTGQVYATLRELILSNKLAPGQALVEAQLASKLGTSKTPVREALLQLEAQGLVTTSLHKGAVVSMLSFKEFIDIDSIRRRVQEYAIDLAVQHITPSELESARHWVEAMGQETLRRDWEAYRRAHRQFHLVVFQASRNPQLANLLIDLVDRMQRYVFVFEANNTAYWEAHDRAHKEAFQAIDRRDAQLANDIFRRTNDENLRHYKARDLPVPGETMERLFSDYAAGAASMVLAGTNWEQRTSLW